MKRNILSALLFLSSLFTIAQSDTALNKMRSFRIKNKIVIGFQMPIDSFKNIVVKDKYGRLFLKKETFGGADEIEIKINAKIR